MFESRYKIHAPNRWYGLFVDIFVSLIFWNVDDNDKRAS